MFLSFVAFIDFLKNYDDDDSIRFCRLSLILSFISIKASLSSLWRLKFIFFHFLNPFTADPVMALQFAILV